MREKHVCPQCGCEMVLKWRKSGRRPRTARDAKIEFDLSLAQREAVLSRLAVRPRRRDRRAADWAGRTVLAALGISQPVLDDEIKARNLLRAWLVAGLLEERLGVDALRKVKPFLYVAQREAANLFS